MKKESEQKFAPHEWRSVKLKEVCNLNPRRPEISRADDKLTSFVQMSSVDALGAGIARAELRPFRQIRKGYTYFGEGDVLFAKITPCMQNGKHAIARSLTDGIGFGSTEFHVLRPTDQILSEWIHAFLIQPWVLQKAVRYFAGTVGQQRVPENFLAELQIPLPPRNEQGRIIGFLHDQLAEVNRARVAVEEQLKAAEDLPAGFFRTAFSRREAQKWPRKQLVECCKLLPSKSIALDSDTDVQAITSACLTEWGFQSAGIKTARMWADNAQKALARTGEILIARSNTPELVGRVAIFPGASIPVVASDLTIRLWPSDFVSAEFLAGYLSLLFVSGYWKERAGGASGTMKKITRSQIENLSIPCPSFSEQNRVAAEMKAGFEVAFTLRERLTKRLSLIKTLPSVLLREAFSGRV